eukprot:COSAG02_NODE_10668_length_1886_cov_2.227756_2_plen_364_part_00
MTLDRNSLRDRAATSLANTLAASAKLSRLSLSDNEVGNAGAVSLAKAVQQNPVLQHLLIAGNLIGSKGIAALQACSQLTSLALDRNLVSGTAVQRLGAKDFEVSKPPASLAMHGSSVPGGRMHGLSQWALSNTPQRVTATAEDNWSPLWTRHTSPPAGHSDLPTPVDDRRSGGPESDGGGATWRYRSVENTQVSSAQFPRIREQHHDSVGSVMSDGDRSIVLHQQRVMDETQTKLLQQKVALREREEVLSRKEVELERSASMLQVRETALSKEEERRVQIAQGRETQEAELHRRQAHMADLEAKLQQREMEVEQVELMLMENAHLFMPQQTFEGSTQKHAVVRMVKELTARLAETSVAQQICM